MSQFEVLDDGRRDPPKDRRGDNRGDAGATALVVFSPDMTEVVTLYGSRFGNRKVPSGGIEEKDFFNEHGHYDSSLIAAAKRGALRETEEETGVGEKQLGDIVKSSVEDPIRGNMMRYYFIAIANTRFTITPFRTKEEGKDHYVDYQRWERIENVLRGASHAGERYNTRYAIAILKILEEMQETGFSALPAFRDSMIDLTCSGILLDEQLLVLEERMASEERERQTYRRS